MDRQKTTMSVSEMRKLLGIKKTESYWLVHKHHFGTVIVEGKIRINIQSFENWYANQVHYKKINGEKPGQLLEKISYSVKEIAELLEITDDTVRELIRREKWTIIDCNHHWRIKKDEFNKWYETQNHYRTSEDRERDRIAEETSLTLPEMGRILCVDRNTAYSIVKNNKGIVVIEIAGKKRITKDSFEYWYDNQDVYVKFQDRPPEEQMQILEKHKNDLLGRELRKKYRQEKKIACDGNKPTYSTKEASEFLGVKESAVLRLIQVGELRAKKINHSWRIMPEDIDWLVRKYEKETKEGF